MKICLMTDTHLSAQKYSKIDRKTGINKFLSRQFESLEWVLNYLKENDIDTIVHAGDVFDSSRVTTYPVKRTKELFRNFNVYAIKGNHDDCNFYHDEKISALDLIDINAFNEPKAEVIDGVNFVFTPWGYEINPELVDNSKKNVLIAHGMPVDFLGSEKVGDTNKGDLLSNKTELFDFVVCGHYHGINEFAKGKTKYLNAGSSLSAYGNEVHEPSIWILDAKDLSYERVKIPVAVQLVCESPKNVNSFIDNIKEENIYRLYVSKNEIIDKKKLINAKKRALEIQFKYKDDSKTFKTDKKKVLDNFWKYVSDNSSYQEEFQNVINDINKEG